MNKVILFSTHCPQCIMLENLLKKKKVNFELKIVSAEELKSMGYSSAPILEVNGKALCFNEAKTWVNKI